MSDIEDYAKECEALEKAAPLAEGAWTLSDYELLQAEPFWRKLAMRYREALEIADCDCRELRSKEYIDKCYRCEALALTRKDFEE